MYCLLPKLFWYTSKKINSNFKIGAGRSKYNNNKTLLKLITIDYLNVNYYKASIRDARMTALTSRLTFLRSRCVRLPSALPLFLPPRRVLGCTRILPSRTHTQSRAFCLSPSSARVAMGNHSSKQQEEVKDKGAKPEGSLGAGAKQQVAAAPAAGAEVSPGAQGAEFVVCTVARASEFGESE